MSNTYEMMFILRPDLTHDQVNKQLHKYNNLLKQNGAGKVSMEIWGKRRLAYQIKKFQDGIYILTYYTGDGTQVAIIERDMRLSDDVIRYLTMKLDNKFQFEEKDIPELQQSTPVISPVESSEEEVSTPEVEESIVNEDSTTEVHEETQPVPVEV
ncbi:30S ribosomal protein S6 [Geminocystis sp.]|uniref:30S ribosomal protein S6 n=1 Tax=Geminocystis sp. TaxID=2664100 RepID=UPI0035936EBB